LLLTCLAVGLLVSPAQATVEHQTAPDNTKVNARDRQKAQKTADQQGSSSADLETTRQIRKAILADKSLSTNAHNVKIITTDGVVTLKGPVTTEAEKKAIETKATEVAGAGKVKSQIAVTDTTHRTSSSKKDNHSKAKGKVSP
jgi:osmotically-inducible protein OsmY